MTPTSATGTRGREGFTLVELLVVIAIMGALAAVVVLTAPAPRPSAGLEAERFAARLIRAREEALLTNRPVAVVMTPGGYAFQSFHRGQWSDLDAGPFGPEAWTDDGAAVLKTDDPGRILFDPTGMAAPAELTLTRGAYSVRVIVDAAGEVRVDG